LRADRQRVGEDDLADPAVLQPVDGGAGQDAVRRRDDDRGGAVVEQRLGGLGDGAGRVDHVVDEDAGAAGDLTDDAVGDDGVGHVEVGGFGEERPRGAAETLGPSLGDPHATRVGGDDGDVAEVVVGGDV